jgi:hypothetical protein
MNPGCLDDFIPAFRFALDAIFELCRRAGDSNEAECIEFGLVAGSAAILTIASCHLPMIGCGVPAGATIPVKVSLSRPGTPSSPLVGKSGSAAARSLARRAMPRKLPSLIAPMAGGNAVNEIGV